MKTALRLTIQFAWAYLGLMSAWLVASVIRGMIVLHRPLPFAHGDIVWRISNSCVMLLGFLFLGMLIRIAWRAVFGFSEQSVNVTVGFVLLAMACVFIYGKHYYLQPWIETHLRSIALRGLVELGISVVGILGCIKSGYVLQRVIAKALFPSPTERKT